jgi:serine O-acetyltransferase
VAFINQVVTGVEIEVGASFGRRLTIVHPNGIVINRGVVVGDDCLLHQHVTIGLKTRHGQAEAPHIGDRVSIYTGATILGAVVIGDDAVIGAHALVMSDVPAGGMAVSPRASILAETRGTKVTS